MMSRRNGGEEKLATARVGLFGFNKSYQGIDVVEIGFGIERIDGEMSFLNIYESK